MKWRDTIEYLTERGPIDIDYLFDEIEELHIIIERGPHFKSMVKCTIVPNIFGETLKVEAAAEL